MTAGGFLCYTKDVFCLFISIEIRRGAERRDASSMGAIKQKKPPGRGHCVPAWAAFSSVVVNTAFRSFGADYAFNLQLT